MWDVLSILCFLAVIAVFAPRVVTRALEDAEVARSRRLKRHLDWSDPKPRVFRRPRRLRS